MPWNDGLDPATPAYQIAADQSQRIRVLAGPGTGKSFAIKKRITRLLEQGADPRRLLAVTFTRMSAADLVRDIRGLNVLGADGVVARTLHAECFRILNSNAVIQVTNRHPRPLAQFEIEPLLADLRGVANERDKRAMRKLIGDYEAAWARLQHEHPGAPRDPADQAFEQALVAWLRFHRAMLIGELVPFAYQYLRDNPAAPERSAYDHVLVDEYQDLNRAEQEVAALLAASGHLAVVGDDDQSIYTFKNAHRTGIIEFPMSNPGTHEHTMQACQRCPGLVISMANALISCNTLRSQPPRLLQPLGPNGDGVVEVFQFGTHSEEMQYLAVRVGQFVSDGTPPGQIIVLSQSRKYVKALHEGLRQQSIPVEFCYQESQLDDDHATERMATLALTGNREDRVCLRYLVGLGSGDWRAGQWARVRALCEAEGLSPWAVLGAMADGSRPSTRCTQIVAKFRQIQAQIVALDGLRGAALAQAWLPDQGGCSELRSIANAIIANRTECDAAALAEGILEVVEQPEIPHQVTDVRIMSLHKSKGLSANVVIIAGCVEGLIPRTPPDNSPADRMQEILEESRRLFFVGLTRVKASVPDGRPGHLILSSSRQVPTAIAMQSGIAGRHGRNGEFTTVASRFMRELGPDCPAACSPAS